MGPELVEKIKNPASQFFFYGYVKYTDMLRVRGETTYGFGFGLERA